ncbi:hypothetical protein ACFLRF_03860 [Candidatus Altiarchaeota archaeon]
MKSIQNIGLVAIVLAMTFAAFLGFEEYKKTAGANTTQTTLKDTVTPGTLPVLIDDDRVPASSGDNDIYAKAISKSKLSLCNDIELDELMYSCRAIITDNLDHCFSLAEDDQRNKCKTRYYLKKSMDKNNPKLCKRIEDVKLQDSCILKYALDKVKPSACIYLSEEKMRIACEERASGIMI